MAMGLRKSSVESAMDVVDEIREWHDKLLRMGRRESFVRFPSIRKGEKKKKEFYEPDRGRKGEADRGFVEEGFVGGGGIEVY